MIKNKDTYKIDGMSCASCAKAVERVTKKLYGVESSSVNIATEKLSREYDKQKVSFDDIKLAIEKAGYKVIKENNTKHIELKIGGMSCAACAKAVERVTKKLDGVEKSNVNIATEKASIEYDSSKVTVSDIKSVIEKAGYSIIEESKKTLELKIGGMTCAACAKAVERVTKKLDGVENSSVNIATEKANIEYDSSKIKLSQIKSAIEKAGYSIIEEKKESLVDEDKLRKEKDMKILLTKFIIAVGFSIPLFYIAMGPMIPKPFGPWPILSIINPMTNPLNYALIQMILVIPVMLAGYKFYTNGLKSLINKNPNMDTLVAIGTLSAFIYSTYTTYKI
ncbi:MAG: copper ion binding protein, partial [Romboutsia sp.]|nr:copper ion binding protein [Romboutsia sp.]